MAEMEKFLLEHGEQVVDVLGAEVVRIELEIKVSDHSVQHSDCTLMVLPFPFVLSAETIPRSQTCGLGNTMSPLSILLLLGFINFEIGGAGYDNKN